MEPLVPPARFLFICRGSVQDGLGHLIRTKAVAQALPQPSHAHLLVIGDHVAKALLEDSGLSWELVHEERQVLARVAEIRPSLIVIDTTHLRDDTFRQLRTWGPTVSLSPIFNQQSGVDLSFSRSRYSGTRGREHRAGLQYAVINPQCVRITERKFLSALKQVPFPVAVSMGGADAADRTLTVVSALREVGFPLLIWVILGEGYGHSYDRLVEASRSHHKHEIILVKANRSMWRILGGVALAVLAGGITSYEAAYAGIPAINWVTNRESGVLLHDLVEREAALLIEGGANVLNTELTAMIRDLATHRHKLLAMHRSGKRLIDGLGAHRIATELIEFLATSSQFRQEMQSTVEALC